MALPGVGCPSANVLVLPTRAGLVQTLSLHKLMLHLIMLMMMLATDLSQHPFNILSPATDKDCSCPCKTQSVTLLCYEQKALKC